MPYIIMPPNLLGSHSINPQIHFSLENSNAFHTIRLKKKSSICYRTQVFNLGSINAMKSDANCKYVHSLKGKYHRYHQILNRFMIPKKLRTFLHEPQKIKAGKSQNL